MTIEHVLSRLSNVKRSGEGWSACCPAHDDRRSSLSVTTGDDGRVLLFCHAGCSTDAICSAVGLSTADLFPDRFTTSTFNSNSAKRGSNMNTVEVETVERRKYTPPKGPSFATKREALAELERRHGRSSQQWTYHSDTGQEVGLIVRWDRDDGKDFRPAAMVEGNWWLSGMPEPRPLYGLPEVIEADTVYVTEGEKAADAIRSLGLIATTSVHGSQSPDKTDWTPLAGKQLVILPDNDQPGRQYADKLEAILGTLSQSSTVRVVELPGLPAKGDAVEWIESFGESAEPAVIRDELERLKAQAEPIATATSKQDSLQFKPFPTEALPGVVGNVIQNAAKSFGCDSSFVALPMLTVFAAAIGNTRRLRLKLGWDVPPILWTAIVAESGSVKSPPLEFAKRPLTTHQGRAFRDYETIQKAYAQDLLYHQRELAKWKASKIDEPPKPPIVPICDRYIIDDVTIESVATLLANQPRGLLLAKDELAGFFGGMDRYSQGKGGDAPKWLEMYGGRSMTVDRKTGEPKTTFIRFASVSISGSIQPAILRKALSPTFRENGTGARFLFAYPPRRRKTWSESCISLSDENTLAVIVDRLYELGFDTNDEGEPVPKVVTMSDDARRVWTDHFNSHNVEQLELSGDLAAAWSKLEETPARLALIVHFIRWATNDIMLDDPMVLDADSMRAGIELAEWFKYEARRIYAMLDESAEDSQRRALAEWIERKGGRVTPRVVQMAKRATKSTEAEAMLQDLVDQGYGVWEPTPTGQRGQPTRYFRLSTFNGNSVSPEENHNTVEAETVDAPPERS